jgi:hypothetical protein
MKAFWTQIRILFIELLVGTALGVLVWEIIGRRLLSFKYGSLGSSVTCAPDVERALADFDGGLRTAAALGAVGFVALTLFIRFVLWRRDRHAKPGARPGAKPATS